MKRFITVLSGLLVLPAFAEVAPLYYDEIVEYTDEMIDAEDGYIEAAQEQSKQNVAQRNTTNRSTTASRAISASAQTANQRASSRAVASSPRSTTGTTRGTASRTARTTNVANRTQNANTSRTNVTSRGSRTTKPVTARVSVATNPIVGSRANTYVPTQAVLNDPYGATLYNANTNANSARVGIGSRRASARISSSLASAATSTPVITEEAVTTTTNNLTAIAELTDYCKAQYAACMDNYCNVLDDNQGRCSCSKNLKNYAKTEAALTQATEDFKDVVQKIKYIGLTGQQIESLFAETEAELTMKSNYDSSRLKTSLDSIKKSIVDVYSPSASATVTSGISLDLNGLLNADFTGGFDLSSFLGSNNSGTTSVSNQRGEQLYKTAASRCKTAVLNSCTSQGIDANVITNSYDLEIDKQCIAYERSLDEANTEMRNNVLNATNILQQARLMLAQNRNSYDVRGCIAALDSCMQDDYVCGSDYELCLDPTGKYLANGEIVKGGTPGVSGGMSACVEEITDQNATTWLSNGMYELYQSWNYTTSKPGVSTGGLTSSNCPKDSDSGLNQSAVRNAWGAGLNETLGGYIDVALKSWESNYAKSVSTEDMATYILQKIGYMDEDDKVHGMCASVMKQCQDYTYETRKASRKYKPNNEVVRQYLAATLTKIKLKQDQILSEYVEDCRSDVTSCLATNGYDEKATTSTISQTAINACRADIQTCMSVGGWKPSDNTKLTLRQMTDWVGSLLVSCDEDEYVVHDSVTNASTCKACPIAYLVEQTGNEAGSVSGCTSSPTTVDFAGLIGTGTADYPKCLYNADSTGYIPIDSSKTRATIFASGVRMVSNGGQATSCSCPEGYNDNHVTYKCTANATNTYSPCRTGTTIHYCVKKAY